MCESYLNVYKGKCVLYDDENGMYYRKMLTTVYLYHRAIVTMVRVYHTTDDNNVYLYIIA